MAFVSTALWADELGVMMPGLTQQASKQALAATVREFCTVSGAWIRRLDDVPIVSGQSHYSLNPQSDATVLYVMSVGYVEDPQGTQGEIVKFLNPLQAPHFYKRSATPSDQPWGFAGDPEIPGRIRLLPTVNTAESRALAPFVALGPVRPFDDQVPEHFSQVHFDVILDGAASKLMGQQDKPYTNIITAQYYARRFRNGMAAARDMARKQFTTAESDFVFPFWAGGGNKGV
jgi:hypothetical protein